MSIESSSSPSPSSTSVTQTVQTNTPAQPFSSMKETVFVEMALSTSDFYATVPNDFVGLRQNKDQVASEPIIRTDVEALSYDHLNNVGDMGDLDKQIERLRRGQLLNESEVLALCTKARELLITDGNILHLSTPITVCGDIHGQFHDLLQLFQVGGWPPSTNYLFLGDFVDRGYNSVETFLLLLALKVRYPRQMSLIRGNHESRQITQIYGFYDECMRKYDSANVWRYCCDVFDYLSLGALIDDSILAVHGGLSPSISTLDQLRLIDRKREVPHEGAMCDLLWSDPEEGLTGWGISPRGAGYLFGRDICDSFRAVNNLSMVCRAHQLVMEGYKQLWDNTLVTVWSAPNYCYRCGNVASIMTLQKGNKEPEFKLFEAAPLSEHGSIPARKPVPEYFL